jgi:hypothetical protein
MASLVHPRSVDSVKSELDIFEPPATQTSLDKAVWHECPPVSQPVGHSPVQFHISGSGDDYIDLMNTLLYVRVRIVDKHGAAVKPSDKAAPVNNLMHSLFSQIEVSLNNNIVEHLNSLYPYRSIMSTLMNYGSEAAKGQLQGVLFSKDTAGSMDETDPKLANRFEMVEGFDDYVQPGATDDKDPVKGNHGLHQRYLATKSGEWVDLIGPLNSDICLQERYLLNDVDLTVKLTRSKKEFYMMADSDTKGFQIQLSDVRLFVRKVNISDHVFLAHQRALMKANAVYPISRVVMKSFSIPQGNMNGPGDNVFVGQLPVEMVIGFVTGFAADGSYDKNPFNFANHGISRLVVKYDGVQVPAKPYDLQFRTTGSSNYMRPYLDTFMANGKMMKDQGSLVSRDDFSRGYALFAFDFRPDIGSRGHYSLKRTGAVQVEVSFASPLSETIQMIVYAEFDSFIEITSSREIITP